MLNLLAKSILVPDRFREIKLSFTEVFIDFKIVCEEQWYFAGIVFHSAEQIKGKYSDCILICCQRVSDLFVEDLRSTKLKAFKVVVESLSLAFKLDSLVHGLELNSHVQWLKFGFKDFDGFKPDVTVHYLATVKVAHCL